MSVSGVTVIFKLFLWISILIRMDKMTTMLTAIVAISDHRVLLPIETGSGCPEQT